MKFFRNMIGKVLLFLCCFVVMTAATSVSFAQKSSSAISVVGCYSDLREISEGIIGNGVIRITKENGKYVVGYFSEKERFELPKYDNSGDACAEYIKRELESLRKI